MSLVDVTITDLCPNIAGSVTKSVAPPCNVEAGLRFDGLDLVDEHVVHRMENLFLACNTFVHDFVNTASTAGDVGQLGEADDDGQQGEDELEGHDLLLVALLV